MIKSSELNGTNVTKINLNTAMLKETLMHYCDHLKNRGDTKGVIKTSVNSVINDLVENKILFDGFTVTKELMIYTDRIFKEKNLKESLNTMITDIYGVAPANIVNEFLSNKYIAQNDKLRSYIEQNG